MQQKQPLFFIPENWGTNHHLKQHQLIMFRIILKCESYCPGTKLLIRQRFIKGAFKKAIAYHGELVEWPYHGL